jgi:hypothetical protein
MPTSGTNGCAGTTNALTYNTSTHAWGCNTLSATGYPATTTLTASSSATLDFTSSNCIATGTYAGYQFRINGVVPATNAVSLYMLVSTNNGSTWQSTGYNYLGWAVDSVTGSGAWRGASQAQFLLHDSPLANTASTGSSFTITTHNLGLSTANFAYEEQGFTINSDGNKRFDTVSGQWAGNVNAVRFLMSSGNISTGTITCQPLPQ